VYSTQTRLPLPVAFPPRMFAPNVDRHGCVLASPLDKPVEPASVIQMTSLQVMTSVPALLRVIRQCVVDRRWARKRPDHWMWQGRVSW